MFIVLSVAVQPTKQYSITLLVNNTEAEDIVLAPSDSLPASGFILKALTCSRLVKRLRSPSAVKFRVWGITTDKPFLLNGEREISVVPSDYQQDETDVSVAMVKPGGKSGFSFYASDRRFSPRVDKTFDCNFDFSQNIK